MANTIVTGHVQYSSSTLPVNNIRVEILDTSASKGILGSARTDINGDFKVFVEDVSTSFQFKTFKGDVQIVNETVGSPVVTSGSMNVTLLIEESDFDKAIRDPETNTDTFYLSIRGSLTDVNGMSIADMSIKIYEKGLSKVFLLAETVTNVRGQYELKLMVRSLGLTTNVLVRSFIIQAVTPAIGLEDATVIATSDRIYWQDIDNMEVNLVAIESHKASSLYESLMDKVATVLGISNDFSTFALAVDFDDDTAVPPLMV